MWTREPSLSTLSVLTSSTSSSAHPVTSGTVKTYTQSVTKHNCSFSVWTVCPWCELKKKLKGFGCVYLRGWSCEKTATVMLFHGFQGNELVILPFICNPLYSIQDYQQVSHSFAQILSNLYDLFNILVSRFITYRYSNMWFIYIPIISNRSWNRAFCLIGIC